MCRAIITVTVAVALAGASCDWAVEWCASAEPADEERCAGAATP